MPKLIENIKMSIFTRFKLQNEACPSLSEWTQTTFEQLSKSINADLAIKLTDEKRQELGVIVSASTLKRIFKYGYVVGEVIDPRKKKTLDLVSIYIGFDDFDSYLKDQNDIGISPEEITNLIKAATQKEFLAYQNIPIIDTQDLEVYFHASSPALEKIIYHLESIKEKGRIISSPSNPSTFEVIKCVPKKISKQEIWVETKEYWYLKWQDAKSKKAVETYNAVNDQIYQIRKLKGVWKIWSNM